MRIWRITVRNNHNPAVRAEVMEKTDAQSYKVVAIPCHKAPAKAGRFSKKRFVVPPVGSFFIRTNGVEAVFSQNFCDCWTEIRVEIVLQHSSAA